MRVSIHIAWLPLAAAIVLVAGLLPGCSGGPSSSASRDRSSSTASSGSGDSTSATFNERTRTFMEQGLRQFSREDPGWESTRAEWLAMGPRESQFLVTSMFAALLKAQSLGAPQLVERARHELVMIGEPAVPFLADLLSAGTVATVYDEVAEENRNFSVDDDARREAAEILALIGPPAAAATANVVGRADTKSGRRFALQALGNMGERGGDAARDGLIRGSTASDWVLRVEAVNGLHGFSDERTRRALDAALGDSEDLVRQKAAESLARRRETASIPALEQAMARARGAGRLVETRRLERAIRVIESGR